MPADFGLLSSTAQVPMKGADLFSSFDPVGATKASYDLAGKKLDVGEKQRSQEQADSDRKILTEAMHSGKYDVSSPDGLESLTKDYGSKLSPDATMRLADLTSKAKQTHAMFQQHLAQNASEQNKLLLEQENGAMPYVGKLVDTYDQVKAAKGEQEARRIYEEGRGHIVTGLQEQKLPNGQPRFSPPIIDWMSKAEPEDARQHFAGSPYRKQLIQNSLNEATIKEREAKTNALNNPQDWQQYTDGDGNSYKWNKKAGVTQSLDKTAGTWSEIPALPPDAKPITGINPKGAQSPLGKLFADKAELEKNGKWDESKQKDYDANVKKLTGGASGSDVSDMNEQQRAWLVEFSASGGKIPQLPMGNSAAGAALRKQFIKDYVTMGMEQGIPATDAAQNQLVTKSVQRSIGILQTQASIIDATSKTVAKALDNVEIELKKIGGIDSPLVRKYWNKSMTEVMGSPEFSALNVYFTEVTEGMAKIYANATGAAPPAIGYLKLAEKAVDPNQSLGQFLKSKPAMLTLMKNRTEGVNETIKEAQAGSRSLIKAQPGSLGKPAAAEPTGDTELDSRAKNYLTVLLPQLKNPQLKPEERKDILVKIRSERDALTKLGAKLPELDAPIPDAAPAASSADKFRKLWN